MVWVPTCAYAPVQSRLIFKDVDQLTRLVQSPLEKFFRVQKEKWLIRSGVLNLSSQGKNTTTHTISPVSHLVKLLVGHRSAYIDVCFTDVNLVLSRLCPPCPRLLHITCKNTASLCT